MCASVVWIISMLRASPPNGLSGREFWHICSLFMFLTLHQCTLSCCTEKPRTRFAFLQGWSDKIDRRNLAPVPQRGGVEG